MKKECKNCKNHGDDINCYSRHPEIYQRCDDDFSEFVPISKFTRKMKRLEQKKEKIEAKYTKRRIQKEINEESNRLKLKIKAEKAALVSTVMNLKQQVKDNATELQIMKQQLRAQAEREAEREEAIKKQQQMIDNVCTPAKKKKEHTVDLTEDYDVVCSKCKRGPADNCLRGNCLRSKGYPDFEPKEKEDKIVCKECGAELLTDNNREYQLCGKCMLCGTCIHNSIGYDKYCYDNYCCDCTINNCKWKPQEELITNENGIKFPSFCKDCRFWNNYYADCQHSSDSSGYRAHALRTGVNCYKSGCYINPDGSCNTFHKGDK